LVNGSFPVVGPSNSAWTNDWRHVVLTYASGTLYLYVDNVLQDSGAATIRASQETTCALCDPGVSGRTLAASMADLIVWDTPLTADERAWLAVPTNSLLQAGSTPSPRRRRSLLMGSNTL